MTDALNASPQLKSEILMQALPHMLRYDDAIVVVKYGGNAMGDEETARDFARDMVLLEQSGINPVVVHGGGKEIDAALKIAGLEKRQVDGLRITDEPTLDVGEHRLDRLHRLALLAFAKGEEVDLETVGIARLGEKPARPLRVVAETTRRAVIAPELGGIAKDIEDARLFADQCARHGGPVDRERDGLAHALVP